MLCFNVTLSTLCCNLCNQYVIPCKPFLPLKIPDLILDISCGGFLGGRSHLTLWIGNTLPSQRGMFIHNHKSLNLVLTSISIIIIALSIKWYYSIDHPEEDESLVLVDGFLGLRGKSFDR